MMRPSGPLRERGCHGEGDGERAVGTNRSELLQDPRRPVTPAGPADRGRPLDPRPRIRDRADPGPGPRPARAVLPARLLGLEGAAGPPARDVGGELRGVPSPA